MQGRAYRQLITPNTSDGYSAWDVDNDLLPYLKRCILFYRRKHVREIQEKRRTARDLEIIDHLEKEIQSTGMFDDEKWFKETLPIRQPRLTDYITLQHAESVLADLSRGGALMHLPKLPKQVYHEKFGILAPSSSLASEMDYWRTQCELREVGLALAYFDIDNFKKEFNCHTETVVDRNCLPVILAAVEAHVFFHGRAYHVGGDEFIVLLPNTDKEHAIEFMDRLRSRLPMLPFVGVPAVARISIGICHVQADCPLTDAEIEQKANDAKQYAKNQGGKDCIVTYRGERYTKDELEVVRPRKGP
jgi:diguanylate cyclase (GGDEF)-like protein